MLQDKDAGIIGRDASLPGLTALLDRDYMAAILRELPQFTGLRSLKIAYLRYKPATSCVATLALQLADGRSCYLAAKALPAGRFAVSWRHPKRQKLLENRDPLAPIALPEWGIILSYPQHDRALSHLAVLNATRQSDALLRRWLPELPASALLQLKILRYKPERRLLALLSCDGRPWATLRFASQQRYAAMLAGNRLGSQAGEIELLATLPEYRLLITRWIEGETLCPEQGGSLTERDIFLLGRKLADLHALNIPLPGAQPQLGGYEAWQVRNTLRAIAPGQQDVFTRVLTRLENGLRNSPSAIALVHGDFTVDQVVRSAAGRQLRLLDWDRAGTGDPAVDLAAFRARLELQAIEKTLTAEEVSRAVAALHAGYRQQCGKLPPRLADYTALALLKLAAEPFRKRAIDWPQQLVALLRRAEALAEESGPPGGDSVATGDRSDIKAGGPLPGDDPGAAGDLSFLLDPRKAEEPLRQALALPALASLRRIVTLASKPGRRAVLEYQWDDAPGRLSVVGKYRHKGVDLHGYLIQQALWRDGFCGDSDVIVPEPLAVLAAHGLWLQQKVAGKRVTESLAPDYPRLAETGELVGNALARLQRSRVAQQAVAGRVWRIADELAILRQRLAQAITARPDQAARIAWVGKACERLAQALSPTDSLFLHRDFYPAQLLLDGDRLAVLDFDLAAAGPPSLDAGNYIAHLREQGLRIHGNDKALIVHEDAFVAAWLAESAAGDIANIGIFTTLALARHIAISQQFPERRHVTEALIDLCETRLKRAIAGKV